MTERDRVRAGTSKGWIVAVAVIAAVVLCAAAWRGVSSRATAMAVLDRETRDLATPTVTVIHPKRGAPTEEIVLPGTLQAFTDAPIYARTSGYLKKRYVEMGDRVKSGQLLAEIDAPELEQQLQQARADLSTADANLRLAQVTSDRYQDLVRTESVSKQDADNATGALEVRGSAVQSARHNVRRLEQLQAFTRIYAPFSGVVTARNTDIGALIDPGASGGAARELFHIASVDRLRVFVNVPQVYARDARPGLEAYLRLAEFPGRSFMARLVRTAQTIDPGSRTLLAEFEAANPAGELLPGSYGEVHVKLPVPAATVVLPVNTLLFRAEGLRVATVRNGQQVVLAAITIGRDYGTEVEVVAGLDARDFVIVSPPDSLVDGQIVRTVQRAVNGTDGSAR